MLAMIPGPVIWTYIAGGVVLAAGVATIFLRGGWRGARGWERLILFGPVFYGAPIAAFGTEHFTINRQIAAIIPAWIPGHVALTYFVGACFIAAGASLATGIQARRAAPLLALIFLLFVILMDAQGFAHQPNNRFAAALMLRELSFCGGALALAAALGGLGGERRGRIGATVARYFIAVPVVFYCVEQFLHPRHVPGIPLEAMTPTWIFGHAAWTYLAAAAYAAGGAMLLANVRARAAATGLGAVVVFLVLVVYVPMAAIEHTSLLGIDYAADTLMYCGAVLMLAGALPKAAGLSAARARTAELKAARR